MKSLMILLFLFSSVISYAENIQPGELHTHDGFFFRAVLGGGNGKTTFDDPILGEYEFTGSSSSSIFQIGWTIIENLVIFYEFSSHSMKNIDLKQNGNTLTTNEYASTVYTSGLGLNYYIMPLNLYFSASLAASKSKLEIQSEEYTSDKGSAINLIIGKEWWSSKNWGLGVAIFFHYSKMEYERNSLSDTADIKNRFGGLAFTATYN